MADLTEAQITGLSSNNPDRFGSATEQATLTKRATAPTPTITQFPPFDRYVFPCEVEFDATGLAWVELIGDHGFASVNVTTYETKYYLINDTSVFPAGIEFLPDGALWGPDANGKVMIRLDPTDGSIQTWPVPLYGPRYNASQLQDGVVVINDLSGNRDGGAWVTLPFHNAIGRFDIYNHSWIQYPIDKPFANPNVIHEGPGNLMFWSEKAGDRIGTIDVVTRKMKWFDASPGSAPLGIAADKNGLLWYSGIYGQLIGSINPVTGERFEITLKAATPAGTVFGSFLPGSIRFGTDGKIYMLEGEADTPSSHIGVYDPATKTFTKVAIGTNGAGPCDMNNAIDGSIYFAEGSAMGNRLARLDYL
ncbi:hypothetical protein RQP46_002110 [Phenoliferia psychrophenolica]